MLRHQYMLGGGVGGGGGEGVVGWWVDRVVVVGM
jgi:hypothetical protein